MVEFCLATFRDSCAKDYTSKSRMDSRFVTCKVVVEFTLHLFNETFVACSSGCTDQKAAELRFKVVFPFGELPTNLLCRRCYKIQGELFEGSFHFRASYREDSAKS